MINDAGAIGWIVEVLASRGRSTTVDARRDLGRGTLGTRLNDLG